MSFIISSVPTVHSGFADYHRPREASFSIDSIAGMEREYAIAHARAEALRSRLAQQQRARQLQAALEQDDLFGNYVVSGPSVAYRSSHRLHFSGSIPSYNPLDCETNRYPGHPARYHASHPDHYSCTRHDQRDFVRIQAALQQRAHEAARARYLANLKRQHEREHAKSVLRDLRSQYDEPAEHRAVVEAQLQALFDPIIRSLGDIETQPQDRKVCAMSLVVADLIPTVGPQVHCPRLHSFSRSSRGTPSENIQDTTKEQAEYCTHPLLSLLVPPTSQSAPVSKPVDRKGKGRETPAIPFPKAPLPAALEPTTVAPIGASSLNGELLKRMAVEKDVDVQDALSGLLSQLLGVDIDLKGVCDAARAPAFPDNPKDKAKAQSVHFVAPEQVCTYKSDETCSGDLPPPLQGSQTTSFETHVPVESKEDNGPRLHRTAALSPTVAQKLLQIFRSRRARKLSLGTIQEIEDQLRKLEASFVFPPHLDFPEFVADGTSDESPSSPTGTDSEFKLAFTPNNKGIHAYEHALNELLTKLDAVESQGDVEVRGRRKEVVGEVEKALNQVSRKVEDSRERASLSDTQIEVNTVEQQEGVVPIQVEATASIQSEGIDPLEAQNLTIADFYEGGESHISEHLAIGQPEIGSHIFTPEETAGTSVATTLSTIPVAEAAVVYQDSEEANSETLTATALGTDNVEDEAYFKDGAGTGTDGYSTVAEPAVETQSEQVVSPSSTEPPFFEDPTEYLAPIVNTVPEPVVNVSPTPFETAPSNFELATPPTPVSEDVTITSEVLLAEVAREDVAIQVSPLRGGLKVRAPAETEDVANVVIQQVAVVPTIEEPKASPSNTTPPIETSPVPAPPTTPTTLSDIPIPSSPDLSESSAERTDEDSFLLQTSPLADPEPRKAVVNNDEDEDIDVLSAGDLEEKDEWSEVEA